MLSADPWSGVQKAPSVHAEGLAGDVAGVVGGEEQHGRRYIQARVAEAPRGYGGDGRRHTLGIGALDFVRGERRPVSRQQQETSETQED